MPGGGRGGYSNANPWQNDQFYPQQIPYYGPSFQANQNQQNQANGGVNQGVNQGIQGDQGMQQVNQPQQILPTNSSTSTAGGGSRMTPEFQAKLKLVTSYFPMRYSVEKFDEEARKLEEDKTEIRGQLEEAIKEADAAQEKVGQLEAKLRDIEASINELYDWIETMANGISLSPNKRSRTSQ